MSRRTCSHYRGNSGYIKSYLHTDLYQLEVALQEFREFKAIIEALILSQIVVFATLIVGLNVFMHYLNDFVFVETKYNCGVFINNFLINHIYVKKQ